MTKRKLFSFFLLIIFAVFLFTSCKKEDTNNMIKDNPKKAEELSSLLNKWREEVKAEFPKPNPDFDPEKRYERVGNTS